MIVLIILLPDALFFNAVGARFFRPPVSDRKFPATKWSAIYISF
jgi:hypothetical protein